MLVLSRKVNQHISIGDNILITITDVYGQGKVRVGIECPEDMKILRLPDFESSVSDEFLAGLGLKRTQE